MYLSNIKLWNFRKFGSNEIFIDLSQPNLDLNFSKGLNVIVGENDSGKTAIIDAIKLVLRTHSFEYIKVEERDFYQDRKHFRIELLFSDLTPSEAKNFTEWLGWIGNNESAEPYLRLVYEGKMKDQRVLAGDIKAGVDDEGSVSTAEAREYLKTTYLKPLRDAENELIAKKNSRLSQILLGDEAFKGKNKDHELVRIFNDLKIQLEKYFKGEFEITNGDGQVIHCPQEGKDIKQKIDNYIRLFYGSDIYNTLFEATSNDMKSVLEKLTLSLANDSHPGLGTLNRLFMAAELLHLNKAKWTGLRLGLIEELEAHLHPQAQMQVIETLQEEKNIQLILTTHSPNLASKVKLENLIVCNQGQAYPLGADYTKLEKTDYSFLERFLDTTKANLFFAKGIIFVEGWSEEILIPALAKKIGLNLTERKVSVINVQNTSFLRYSRIFQRKDGVYPKFKIPVAIITDLDVDIDEENLASPIPGKTKKIYKKDVKEQKYNGDTVQTFVSPHKTLEYCLGIAQKLNLTLFVAIKKAGREMTEDGYTGKLITQTWKEYTDGKADDIEISKSLYNDFIGDGKKISKAIIAQHLACFIEKECITKDILERETSIKYLLDAIKYATGN